MIEAELPMLYMMQRPLYKSSLMVPKVRSNEHEIKMQYQQLSRDTQRTWRVSMTKTPELARPKLNSPKSTEKSQRPQTQTQTQKA